MNIALRAIPLAALALLAACDSKPTTIVGGAPTMIPMPTKIKQPLRRSSCRRRCWRASSIAARTTSLSIVDWFNDDRTCANFKTEITPEIVAEHGLSPEEYERVLHALGREPNLVRARHLLGDVVRALLVQILAASI
jgi:hypothetical protein